MPGAAAVPPPPTEGWWAWLSRIVTRPHTAVVLLVENAAYSIYCMVRDVATALGFPARVVRGVRQGGGENNNRRVRRKRLHFVTRPAAETASLESDVVMAAAPAQPPVEDTDEMGSETEALSDIEVDVEFHSTTAAGAEGVPALPGVAPGATAADLADDVVVAVGGDGSFHNVLNATIQQLDGGGGVASTARPSAPKIPVAFGIVPRGSDNGAANSLGLSTERKALAKLGGAEPPKALDVMELVIDGNTAASVAAPIAAMWQNNVVEGRVEIELDGEITKVEGPFATVIVINLAQGSDVLTIVPGAKPDDGVMNVVIAEPGTRLDYISVFWGMLRGTLEQNEKVAIYKADRVLLDTETGALDVSGEKITRQAADESGVRSNTKVDITLHPSCIEAFF
eukprot:gene8374-17517_t